jgi:hypothetical protein
MNTAAASSTLPVLYYSEGLGGRGSFVDLISPTLPAVIYVGGGYELDSLHGVGQLDDATTSFLNYLATSGFNVIAPVGWYVPDYPSFPLTIAALLKYGFLINQVYLIGWSAGGVASAWALTHDFHRILNLAVIMDAELAGPTETGTHTDLSVFTTAQSSSQVSIPHLLVWGADDSGPISIQTAGQWFKNAQPGLVRVDPHPYSHTWLGSSAEPLVRQDITSFFKAGNVGSFEAVPSNSAQTPVAMQVTTNNALGGINYNSSSRAIKISVSNQANAIGVLNLVVPRVLLNGDPVIISGKGNLAPSTFGDANNYYIFFSYTNSTGGIIVSGQNSIPEFPSLASSLVTTVMLFMLLFPVFTRKKPERRKRKVS